MSQGPPSYVPAQPQSYGPAQPAQRQAQPQSQPQTQPQTQSQTQPQMPPAGQATATLPAAPTGTTPGQRATAVAAQKRTTQNTPRLILVLMAVGVTAALLLGVIGSWQLLAARQASLAAAHNTEQLIRVQKIQTDLLHADAVATNAFLVGGLEPEQQRADYDAAITQASQLIAEAAEAQPADREALEQLNTAVTDYAAQIELARANNRQAFPVGAEYLKQASATLRTTAMPLLDNLVAANGNRASDALSLNGPLLLLGVGLVGLVAVAAVNVLAARRFRRILNPGLALGLGLMLVMVVLGGAILGHRSSQGGAISAGSFDQVRSLATARTAANDAKAFESLTLIARGSGGAYETAWKAAAQRVTDSLPAGTPSRTAWDAYATQHTAVREADDSGSWETAVDSSIGTGEANKAFATFDAAAAGALDAASARAGADLSDSGSGTLPGAIVIMVLALATAVLTVWGLGRRMREYQ